MNSKIALFLVFAVASIIAMITPIEYALAQSSDSTYGEKGEYKGEHEGKSCPSKEKKSASTKNNFEI